MAAYRDPITYPDPISHRSTRVARLAADPSVDYVEADQRVHLADTQTAAPWGLGPLRPARPAAQPEVTAHAVADRSVADLSLGGGTSSTLDAAVRRSIAAGITYAIAAGNSGVNASNSSPARVTEALTVGATDRTDTRASWSNYGAVVDLFAPGVGITSDWRTSNTATYTGSGTSFSSPHVAGAAALYLTAHPGATPSAVGAAIVAAATTGVVTSPGSGSPNRLLYTSTLSS